MHLAIIHAKTSTSFIKNCTNKSVESYRIFQNANTKCLSELFPQILIQKVFDSNTFIHIKKVNHCYLLMHFI